MTVNDFRSASNIAYQYTFVGAEKWPQHCHIWTRLEGIFGSKIYCESHNNGHVIRYQSHAYTNKLSQTKQAIDWLIAATTTIAYLLPLLLFAKMLSSRNFSVYNTTTTIEMIWYSKLCCMSCQWPSKHPRWRSKQSYGQQLCSIASWWNCLQFVCGQVELCVGRLALAMEMELAIVIHFFKFVI